MTVPLSRRALLALPAAALLRAASPLFTFHESFWLNLHHFLYVLARLRNKDSWYARSPAIADKAELSDEQQAAWERAVTAYSTSVSKQDLVFDRGLAHFTKALSETADDTTPGKIPAREKPYARLARSIGKCGGRATPPQTGAAFASCKTCFRNMATRSRAK